MFQTLALNKAFLESNSVIKSIGFVFQAGSFLLAIITFFYILYANSFLLSLRQKEFGMYMMLGAKKHKVTLLMFIETIVLGLCVSCNRDCSWSRTCRRYWTVINETA